MTTTINAVAGTGLVQTSDASGIIKLQSAGVTTNALAWVNFNGTGTVAIRSSYNVSSITDNGTGDYTVNFATALSDSNYSFVGLCRINGNNLNNISLSSASNPTTTATRVITNQGTLFDADYVNVAIFGN
jgi:hypothetical protein